MERLNIIGSAENALDKVVLKKINSLKMSRAIHLSNGSVNSFWKAQEDINLWARMLKGSSVSVFDYDNPDFLDIPQNVTSLEQSVQLTQSGLGGIAFCSLQLRENQQYE